MRVDDADDLSSLPLVEVNVWCERVMRMSSAAFLYSAFVFSRPSFLASRTDKNLCSRFSYLARAGNIVEQLFA